MLMKQIQNKTHQQILAVADHLFSTRGYKSVRLRDIADAVNIKHAALYYYVPNGKEQLFVDVMERSFERHRLGMTEAISAAGPDLRAQLMAAADWLLAHPPLNIAHMEQSDFSAIKEANAQKLSNMIFDALRLPLREALVAAEGRGEIELADVDLAALSFVTLVQAVHGTTNAYLKERKQETVASIIEMLLQGWFTRS